MNKRFRLGFIGGVLIWVPVVLVAVFERPIVAFMGRPGWIVLLVVFGLGGVALEIFPFFGGGPGSYYFFWGKGRRARKVLESGKRAEGDAYGNRRELRGGSVTINDDPYLNLRLRIDDGLNKPYEVSLDAVISRYILPQFQPGESFPVRVDPQDMQVIVYDTNQAALDGSGIVLQGTKPQISGFTRTPEETEVLHKKGIKATAKSRRSNPPVGATISNPLSGLTTR